MAQKKRPGGSSNVPEKGPEDSSTEAEIATKRAKTGISIRCAVKKFVEVIKEIRPKVSKEQLEAVNRTLFSHFFECQKILCSQARLEALIKSYDVKKRSFLVGKDEEVEIPFAGPQFSCVLGLHYLGQRVDFRLEEEPSSLEKFFEKKKGYPAREFIVKAFMDSVGEGKDVDDFVRLYILLVFSCILFPTSHLRIPGAVMHYVDELDTIGEYAWGEAVYSFLVDSIEDCVVGGKAYVDGCTIGLWAWFYEIVPSQGTMLTKVQVPRMNRWKETVGRLSVAACKQQLSEIVREDVVPFYPFPDEKYFEPIRRIPSERLQQPRYDDASVWRAIDRLRNRVEQVAKAKVKKKAGVDADVRGTNLEDEAVGDAMGTDEGQEQGTPMFEEITGGKKVMEDDVEASVSELAGREEKDAAHEERTDNQVIEGIEDGTGAQVVVGEDKKVEDENMPHEPKDGNVEEVVEKKNNEADDTELDGDEGKGDDAEAKKTDEGESAKVEVNDDINEEDEEKKNDAVELDQGEKNDTPMFEFEEKPNDDVEAEEMTVADPQEEARVDEVQAEDGGLGGNVEEADKKADLTVAVDVDDKAKKGSEDEVNSEDEDESPKLDIVVSSIVLDVTNRNDRRRVKKDPDFVTPESTPLAVEKGKAGAHGGSEDDPIPIAVYDGPCEEWNDPILEEQELINSYKGRRDYEG